MQQKPGAAWNITTNSSTTDKTAVKGGDTVDLVNGDNIEITQDGTDKKKITVATKKDITVDSVTADNKSNWLVLVQQIKFTLWVLWDL